MSKAEQGRKKHATHTKHNTVMKIVILGDGGVGKSCVMTRFVTDRFDESSFHTIGVEFLNRDVELKGDHYTLQIWDTAGQERFKSLRTPFYRGSDICMLTFSVTNRKSFESLAMWKREFLCYADVRDPESFPFVVLGNKCDVDPSEREVKTTEAETWCKTNGDLIYVETSAKDSINVDYAFSLAVENWRKMENKLDRPGTCDTVNLNKMKKKNQTECCS